MLVYKLTHETGSTLEYTYYPEGDQQNKGIVSISKEDGSINIVKLSPVDNAMIYAMHLFNRLRQFQANEKYENQGTVSWY